MSRRLKLSLHVLSLSMMTAVTQPASAQTLDATSGARVIPFSRGDTVAIGLPFDTVTGELLGPNTCLEGFKPVTDTGAGAQFNKRLVQVSEQLSVMHALDIDVSASGKVFGSSASGKIGFAQQTKFSQSSLNYALFADYQAPPQKIEADGSIRLTPDARDTLFGSDPATIARTPQTEAAFRAKCGDAYISLIFQGAQAYALLSFLGIDQSKNQAINSAMKASGVGWDFSASAKTQAESELKSGKLTITLSQTGGIAGGEAAASTTETEWDKVVAQVEGIKGTPHPATTAYQVVAYGPNLSNWSGVPLSPSPDIQRLVYYRAAYEALLNMVNPMVTDPFQAEFTHVLGRSNKPGAGDREELSALQTDILDARDAVNTLLKTCATWQPSQAPAGCADTDGLDRALKGASTPHPYEFMTRLPLYKLAGTDYFLGQSDLANKLFQQNLVSARNAYCADSLPQGFKHPACIGQADLKSGYFTALSANVAKARFPAPGGYVFRSESSSKPICLTAQSRKSASQELFMQSCTSGDPSKAQQRFDWQSSGQLQIRTDACIAGPIKEGAGTSAHSCDAIKEPQQLWRFIPTLETPLPRDKAVHGLIQEAGYGRCLQAGKPKAGEKTYVVTKKCDPNVKTMLWTAQPH